MSSEARVNLAKILAFTAEYYGRELKKEVIAMMIDDLSDLPYEKVEAAYFQWRRNPKNKSMPLPAQIREIVDPQCVDDDAIAREIAARILQSVDHHGYTWPKEARAYIGEVGWSVIATYGGWENFCAGLGIDFSVDAFHAQARELIKARVKYGTTLGDKIQALEYKSNAPQIAQNQDALKMLTIKQVPK